MQNKVLKSILFLLFILMTVLSHSQSIVQKYNSLMNRYEYYGESGRLIGYKSYNALLKQWEYYDNDGSKRKTDFGIYVPPVNLNLVQSTLKNRQARYDENRELVQNFVVDLGDNLFNSFVSETKGEYVARLFFEEVVKTKIFKKTDFSNSSLTNKAITQIKNLYYSTKKNAEK